MRDKNRTKEERGLAPREEEMREKMISKSSTAISDEGDRTKEERGLASREEEMREKKIGKK